MDCGNVAIALTRNDVITSVGSLEVCTGCDADDEALVYTMHSLYNEEETEAVLLANAGSVFNLINQTAFLNNNNMICTSIATFAHNCYFKPLRLFVQAFL